MREGDTVLGPLLSLLLGMFQLGQGIHRFQASGIQASSRIKKQGERQGDHWQGLGSQACMDDKPVNKEGRTNRGRRQE